VSKAEIKDYCYLGADSSKIRIVPNGVDVSEFFPRPPSNIFKKDYHLKENVVLYVGRLVERKSVDFLINAFSRVIKEFDDTSLLIVGEFSNIEYESKVRMLISDLNMQRNIVFTGSLSGRKLVEAYNSANVVVYPSKWEIFGMVAIEAAACGKPIIVPNNAGGLSEIVEHEKTGFLVDYPDNECLSRRIIQLLGDKSLAKRMGLNGRNIVTKKYAWKIIVDKLEDIYEDLL